MTREPEESAYVGLGGNLGDPVEAMRKALDILDADPSTRVVEVSPIYRTPPWGKTDQPDFLNAAAVLKTTLPPRGLLALFLDTERRLKRVRAEHWGPRVIDMDLLAYGRRTIAEPGLDVPHPRMLDRAFVLVPLADIAPDLSIAGKTIATHLAAVDRAGIEKMSDRDWWKR